MRNTPTQLVLLEIAESLQQLIKNPDVSKSITDAYALMDSERAKAEDARNVMGKADKFLAEIKAKENALAVVNERIAEAGKLEKSNDDAMKKIAQLQSELDVYNKQNLANSKANELEKSRLVKERLDLEKRIDAVKEDEDKIKKVRADLKKRSEIMAAPVEIG